ncbi:gamma-tubulin complex component 6 [Achroia grisella]|uniref:gamma-tubulin complex component 6 n=1 Tax=Achroia grisella TaxID=688607 RepID=UPI0027D30908|nr:gamma-tubulin complex component 6 [Achroia grisella]
MGSFEKDMAENDGVFDLVTALCQKTASKYCGQNRIPQHRFVSKMRTQSYEILLRKTPKAVPCVQSLAKDPINHLLCYNYISQQNIRNVIEYNRYVELKKIIGDIRNKDFGEYRNCVDNILRFLIALSNTVKDDFSVEMYKNPFSFGALDKMLPKPPIESYGSPQPYSYYPPHVFELPYSLRKQASFLDNQRSQTYTEYTVESFDSKSFLVDTNSQVRDSAEVKTFLSPMSLASMTSTHLSPYSETMFNYPQLTAPRDLKIPGFDSNDVNIKFSLENTNLKSDVKEVFRADIDEASLDIWELATQVDKDIPDDIWDTVAKLPLVNERQLIASSPRELLLWRRVHEDVLSDLSVVAEKQFIRHIMYLIIGVETNSFPFNHELNSFYMKRNLVLEGISKERLNGYVSELLNIGTYYRRLYKFAFNHKLEDHFHSHGLVYEAAREVIRRYLLEFRLFATEIYEECTKNKSEDLNCMPTLLQILYHMEPLQLEIETVVSVYKMIDSESTTIPHGAELMSYLFNEISLVTEKRTAFTMFNMLFSICKVYFKFIERFIFEGELNDRYHEFFIRKDSQYVNCRSKRYWDKGYHISQSVAIPDFLRSLARFILLCGKSLRLLKLCNPSDPLVLLISSDHPSVKCCASFDDLQEQQQILDVYRTRCLFVSGEPVTFDQILLKREAEKKAFTEMASVKQAETLEKIIAERKRLGQLIIAEKQHSLRVLEAAMAEAAASRRRSSHAARLMVAADTLADDVDSRIRDDERNKIMEYYSKLNMEVEKSKIHTEWKIRRLQLDQSRIQLLSTEERNLKREKLELEHQKNEEVMAMSIQSIDYKSDDEQDGYGDKIDKNVIESSSSIITETGETSQVTQTAKQTTSDMFSVICNAAKSIFGVSKHTEEKCDNNNKLDAQGNIVGTEVNSNIKGTSSEVIGSMIDEACDNVQFMKTRQEALLNKQKVMSHEYGTDKENNVMKDPPLITMPVDEENNLQEWTPFSEAKRNRIKVLGTEFNLAKPESKQAEPATEAQKEALLNKNKVLRVEYNLPAEEIAKREPANIAQEEALRNKKKILGSEYDLKPMETNAKQSIKRAGLTLNLKPYGETSQSVVANTGSVTPDDFFPTLDLETPTTAEIPVGGQSSDAFTPRCEFKDLDTAKTIPDNNFISSNGFNFSMIDDIEIISNVHTEESPDISPMKSLDPNERQLTKKYSFFNMLDGEYEIDNFDPFGVKHLKNYSKEYFSNKLDAEMATSCYTHPGVIMEEVKKRPYANIFGSHEEKKEEKINCDNIATLTACLQRSVMLPLTYQLEVVNNSILTYFLVNLDMYEHLRSLKDYFFLMDGEFSRSICHNLFTKLTKTLNPQELLNFGTLHNILDKALGSSISHVHKFSENLSFTITESPLSFQHSSPDVLQCLSLTYAVEWPLNIILSQEALLRYAKVFQFLVKMRRIFWVLGEDFEALKLSVKFSRQHSRKLLRSPQYISIQIYRHNMAAMIRALDNYIVTTCILSSWTEFENDLKKARTLDDLYECHVVYIKKVLFRCLLNNRSTPVMKLLNDIFTVILKFSRVLKSGEWHQKEANGHFVHTSYPQLQELFHLFEKLAKYLHKVVTKLMECGYQRHLVELLTMVNLNGYYEPDRSKDEHSTPIKS